MEDKKIQVQAGTLLRFIVALGLLGLIAYVFFLISANPRLLAVNAFVMLATLLLGNGGFGQLMGNLFGGTQTGSEVMKAQSDAVIKSTPPPPHKDTTQ